MDAQDPGLSLNLLPAGSTPNNWGRKHSAETKAKMSLAQKGINSSNEAREIKAAAQPAKKNVIIFDTEKDISTSYLSINQAAKALGVYRKMIPRYFASGKPILGRYQVTSLGRD